MLSYAEQMRANIEAYHRERRRKNQERYRAKQRQMAEDLQVNNHKLQEELQQLQRTRDMLSVNSIKAKETVWSVAVEYFRVFRRGLLSTEDTDLLELDFLKATMAPDLDAGTVRGLEALARNWKAFTQFFQDVQIRLGRLDEVAENSLVASTTTSITITRHSLSCMFPHLISDGHEGAEGSHIASRLLNQRIVMRGSVHLNWDSDSNRVISLITQADMLSPVLQLLGNLEDVSLTFTNALISPDCNLVETKYLNHQQLYRKRQQKLMKDLESNNQQLREESEGLSRQLYILSSEISKKTSVWSVAMEYFRVFHRGLLSCGGVRRVELEFLKAAMAPDLNAGTVRGFKNLVVNWELFTCAFQDVRVQLGRLDQAAENSLVASTTTSFTFTEMSLSNMFPCLSDRVATKLLGQRLVLRGSVRFDWDSTNKRVVSLISQADMLSPILKLLGSLQDASLVFTNARIQPDGNLVTTAL
ncbi:Hypothetical protein PHPALM_20937 [Phytophthora palmivora]|uniref:Bzip transcription factor n=1 Tax=Phytophthora palmivora TaxID=4796 RepID=A0A2P4XDK2_9STRA|nr:Hypothetical protein PHPALM_20937 [Phytophthora palmivora]